MDNTTLNAGSGGNTIRTLDDGSVHWPAGVTAFATTVGTPDVLEIVKPTTGLPVRLADGSGYISTLPVSLASVPSHAVTNAGTFAVQVDGAALTALQLIDDVVFAEDAAHATGDKGVQVLAVRKDTAAALAGADGDYIPLSTNSAGRLWVDASGQTLTVDTHAVTQSGTWNVGTVSAVTSVTNTVTVTGTGGTFPVTDSGGSLTVDNAALSVTGGGVEASALRVTIASDSTGLLSVDDNGGSLTVDNAALSVTGGGVEASALRVTIASDSTGVLSVDDNGGSLTVDGTVAATQSGTWNVGTVTTVTTVSALTGGGVAHDAADSGSPVKVGARATNVNITAVANNDRSDLITDLTGKLVTSPYSVPEVSVDGTASATNTSDTQVIAAQGAGVRIYVTTLVLANSSSTNITVTVKSATTAKMTVPVPAGGGCIVPLPKPLRLGANEALNFAASSGVTTAYCSAVGFAAP